MLQGFEDSLGPLPDFRLVGLGLSVDFEAFNDDIGTKPFKSGFDDVDGTAEVREIAVSGSETGDFVSLGVDKVELLEQRIKVILKDYFVITPCGATEKDHIPPIAKAGRAGIGGVEEGGFVPGLIEKTSEDFREGFRVAGRGAVNDQYFAHDALHDETVLSLHTRSFWPEKAMRTHEDEKRLILYVEISLPDAEGLLPRGIGIRLGNRANHLPAPAPIFRRQFDRRRDAACFHAVREKTIMTLKFFFK